jgi:hypothetical protein
MPEGFAAPINDHRVPGQLPPLAASSPCPTNGQTSLRTTSDITRVGPVVEVPTTGALVLAGALMLSWVALSNQATLVFADSLGYATAPLRGEIPGFFSIFSCRYFSNVRQTRKDP